VNKAATRYKLREQEGGNHRGEEWRRKWQHHSPQTTKNLGGVSPWIGGWGPSMAHIGAH